jgi:N6-L-threonylcarbamoyladenine synthase
LRIKCKRAAEQTGLKQMIIAGGVSANQALRAALQSVTQSTGCKIYYPALKLCTDNGAMIAYAGMQHLNKGHSEPLDIIVRPRWPMTEMS